MGSGGKTFSMGTTGLATTAAPLKRDQRDTSSRPAGDTPSLSRAKRFTALQIADFPLSGERSRAKRSDDGRVSGRAAVAEKGTPRNKAKPEGERPRSVEVVGTERLEKTALAPLRELGNASADASRFPPDDLPESLPCPIVMIT